ncbi:threonine/serine dehydratase [Kineococcus radiotolerans]|uniref:Pyridoxal-5'-phosphate-dependent protein beta subunit n=1 Tax=Kineococcus radiotolerans (strain ATCC BAA-149 / DSM 14245 / SRS30216) TaxID=266940 RepID=A6W413_KINRD|nr:threonine/serine dehydratase [Kineococcus radiotolerans]ABS01552.1 Pyridoxal-5'-phosphate-dependent protein beta subunit [Kineococcus radiotolerans SRS30216 = ATCC BAA-149]
MNPLAAERPLSLQDVQEAAARTAGRVRRTPVLPVGAGRWLKLEQLQHTGSFKARGAFNRQLAARERGELDPVRGIVAASGGNAGLAHAHAAAELGVPATVFVPGTAPAVKVDRLRGLGADVRLVGNEYAQAHEAAVGFAEQRGAVFCHAYDQPEIAAGAGTLALELLEDVPDLDTVVVAVGGGGLFAGVAAALEGRVRVVAVETAGAPTLHRALAAGEPVDVAVSGVAADSLGARRVGAIAFDLARRTSPVSLLVEDAAATAARSELWSRFRVVAEHGAATAWAGLGPGGYEPADGEQVAVVVCGANTDPATL